MSNDTNNETSGPEAAVESVTEGVKGKAKEVIGAVTGDEDLTQEGRAQQDKAEELDDVADKEAEAEKARTEAMDAEERQKQHQ